MKISRNGQYALLSVVDLAMHAADGHESISNIAKRQNIDPRFLAQIFFGLKNAGIITSVRGKDGGYYLCGDINTLTAGDVVRAVEGELAPTPCSKDDGAARSCDSFETCLTRSLWQQMARLIGDTLNGITIADIIDAFRKEQNHAAG